jgi:hypothetical protein
LGDNWPKNMQNDPTLVDIFGDIWAKSMQNNATLGDINLKT